MLTNTEDKIAAFLNELNDFVEAEHREGLADVSRRRFGPLEERVRRGDTIGDVSVESFERSGGEYRIEISFPSNDSRYREGDCVRISADTPDEDSAALAEGRVLSIHDNKLEMESRRCRLTSGHRGLTVDAAMIDMRSFYEHALVRAGREANGRDKIIPMLLGDLQPNGASPAELSDTSWVPSSLNKAQRNAVVQCAAVDLTHLVQGPPGTGKTKVLAALVQRLLAIKPNAAILVTSFTHRAIDNAVERIIRDGVAQNRVWKVGGIPPSGNIPHLLNLRDSREAKDGGPIVIGATPFALKNRVQDVEFDWVIVDEASQMTLPLAVMAMIAGKRWIFFGDDKQMPPVVLSLPAHEAVKQSVFGVLKKGGNNTMLTTTYRLPEPLAAWPSASFYKHRLVSGGEAVGRRLKLVSVPTGFESILSAEPAAVFISIKHQLPRTTSSPEEIEQIVGIVKALDSVQFDLGQIGVVVPYRRQARLLRNRLQEAGIFHDKLIADTVERMQGQEKDVIIVSFTTSDISFATKMASFLFQPERLNVAITRPMKKLIVVGSDEWLTRIADSIPEARLYKSFIDTCAIVSFR